MMLNEIPVFNKFLEAIDLSDIEDLVNNKNEESIYLDYKEEINWKGKEIGKDICGFANTEGGLIIYGIREDSQTGYPEEIKYIERTTQKHSKPVIQQYENVCLGNADPTVKLNIKFIESPSDSTKGILIVHIPRSDKVHMSNGKYYKRVNVQIVPMTNLEVENRFKSIREGRLATEADVKRIQLKAKESTVNKQSILSQLIIALTRYDEVLKSNANVFIGMILISLIIGSIIGFIPIYTFGCIGVVDPSKYIAWSLYFLLIPLIIIIELTIPQASISSVLNFEYMSSDYINFILLIIFYVIAIPTSLFLIIYGKDISNIRNEYFKFVYIQLSQEFSRISFTDFLKLSGIIEEYNDIYDYWELDYAIIEVKKDNKFLILQKQFTEEDTEQIRESLCSAYQKMIDNRS